MKKLLLVVFIALLYWSDIPGALVSSFRPNTKTSKTAPPTGHENGSDQKIREAYHAHQSGVQIQGRGHVSRLLPDDNVGSRHQRFIMELASGQTLLVAHNIDLASRIHSLQAGDAVEFNGVYEWNAEGGVIHWTHRDPQGRHEAGWLKHNGRKYQRRRPKRQRAWVCFRAWQSSGTSTL